MGQENDFTKKIEGVTSGEETIVISLDPYSAGDVVGGLIVFDTHLSPGGGGRITDFYLTDATGQQEPYTLYFFDKLPVEIDDADPFDGAQVIADMDKLIAIEDLPAGRYTVLNSLSQVHLPDLEINFEAQHGKLGLFAVPVATPDYDVITDIQMFITVLLN